MLIPGFSVKASRSQTKLAFVLLGAVAAFMVGTTESRASDTEPVNYDDPNLVITNEFVGDSATSCSKTLKGKALDQCLLAQAPIPDDAVPLRTRRIRAAR